MLFGASVCGALLLIAPAVLWWSLPLTAGYLLAVPFAVLTAHPAFGRALQRLGLCGVPEDFVTPGEVNAVTGNGGERW
jgi:membrane glycosyltransferase